MSFSELKKCKLGQILNFRRGHDLPKKDMIEGEYPVVGSNGIIGYHNKYTTVAPCLTIGRSGNVGTPHFVNQNCWAHNTTLYVDDFKGNNPRYIYYLLKTLDLARYSGGSAVPTLNRNHIHPMEVVYIGNIKIQKTIANILSTIDDKIEINNQINEKLQLLSQLLFKHWFVDFEFPNEEGLPYKSSGGEMVDSELGMIPKGWEVRVLGDIIEISSGKRPKKKPTQLSELCAVPLAGASSIMGYVEEYNFNEPILVIGRVGTHGVIQRFNSKVWASDNTLVIKSNYYEYTNQILSRIDYNSLNRGSTQPLITQTDIKNQKIIIPKKGKLNEFEELVSSLYNLVNNNLIEIESLTNLRNILLPKLMSGEIDLSNLELNC